ncbi:MAG: hypothetical protein ABR538_17770 [Candidatus Binatia bacterium]
MRPTAMRLLAPAVLAAAASACTPTNSRITLEGVRPLHDRAVAICSCLRAGLDLPRRRFTTDVCSVSPDRNYGACCIDHDVSYWCGGSEIDRLQADRRLALCVEEHGHSPRYAEVVRRTVRVGGGPWSPFPWRWAYGWKTLRGYEPRPGGGDAEQCFAPEGPAANTR